jgi:hypothetical protein
VILWLVVMRHVRSRLHVEAAATVADLCHWRQGVGNARDQTHALFHFGSPCPYMVAAAVLQGQPDPRDAAGEQPSIADLIRAHRFDWVSGEVTGPDSFYAGMLEAEAIARGDT